jgi:hypothetical protein
MGDARHSVLHAVSPMMDFTSTDRCVVSALERMIYHQQVFSSTSMGPTYVPVLFHGLVKRAFDFVDLHALG